MRIHYFQHVPYEPPAYIEKWAEKKGYSIKGTHFYKNDLFPDFSSFDLLVVMGGPMGVYDEDKYPFLRKEKVFIENAIRLNKKVLGICLGAQLIAEVLGARVYKNKEKEIGWFPTYLTPEGKKQTLFQDFPDEFMPLHWHGDTFEIPSGAVRTAYSDITPNQAFVYGTNVVALQFHLEVTPESLKGLIDNSKDELEEKGNYIQSPQQMLSKNEYFVVSNSLMEKLLENLTKSA